MTHRILLSLSRGVRDLVVRRSRFTGCRTAALNCRTKNRFGSPAARDAKQRHLTAEELGSWFVVLLCAALFFLSSCSSTKQYPAGSFIIDGVMHHTNVEGGCWVFKTTDGQSYELTGDAIKGLLREGLRAEIVVKLRRDLKSICMVGKIVEVLEIREIHSNSSPR